MVGNENKHMDDGLCFLCGGIFEDLKSIAECTGCKNVFHVKCENIDLRGFHLRKSYWKCKACEAKPMEETSNTRQNKPRKRSRTEEQYIDQFDVDHINATLQALLNNTNELNKKVDYLITENNLLKEEIILLKQQQNSTRTSVQQGKSYAMMAKNNMNVSYSDNTKTNSSITKNDNKTLLIRQKSNQSDVSVVKQDLKNKVNPTELGISLSMGKTTRDGGVILNCSGQQNIDNIQTEIQNKLGDKYSVNCPKIKEHRVKVVGIEEEEYNRKNEEIVEKIIKQNHIRHREETDFKIKILRKSNVFNKRFNIIMEVDTKTYQLFTVMEKISIGWTRCPIYSDYGILRCLNCCRYGHLSKECKEKTVCPRCSEDHELKNCNNKTNKCINCVTSNTKYGLKLDTNHVVWDVQSCDVYRRCEQVQMNKFKK